MTVNNLIKIFVGIFLALAALGCEGDKPVRSQGKYSDGSIYKSDKDTPLPRKLVGFLEKEYISVYKEENADTQLTDMQLALQVPRRLLQVVVYLKEKNKGTLVQDSRFILPQGGATVDLAEYVNEGKGIFYSDFGFKGLSSEEVENIKVYFVSNAKRYRVGNEVFGAGCGKFFDITNYFHKTIRQRGMELAAANLRYLGQTLGSFFFSYVKADALHVGSASFVDSRYPDSHCIFPEN